MKRLDFHTNNWTGPAGRTLQQGVKWDGTDFYVYQADKVPGGENLVIRRYDSNLTYRGYLTIPNGGHGSTTGVIRINPTTSRHILPAMSQGIRVVDYQVGNPKPVNNHLISTVGHCSAVSCNNGRNRLSVRKGGSTQTVNWYNRDDVLAGKKVESLLKFSFKTPSRSTFQGHYNWNDSDFFHWETDGVPRGSANYRTWIDEYKNGKHVRKLDTTALVNRKAEPEGLMGYQAGLYAVKKAFTSGNVKLHLVAIQIQ